MPWPIIAHQTHELCKRNVTVSILVGLLDRETVRYQGRSEDAAALIEGARVTLPDGLSPAELAARIVVANVILNLDEFLVRG